MAKGEKATRQNAYHMGRRVEQEIVRKLKQHIGDHTRNGLKSKLRDVRRVKMGEHKGRDIEAVLSSADFPIRKVSFEVKHRHNADGFKKVLDWLGENDGLFLRMAGDSDPTCVVITWELFLQMMID